jgi:translocation-and-assembly-module (TAM) inner membrane subunit TamB-like protein
MARRWVRALVVTATLMVGASAAAVLTTQTAWFRDWLRGYIVKHANQTLNGQLSIRRLGGNLFYGVELENVSLTLDGREAVTIRNVGVKYNAFQLVTRGISIEHVRLDQPVIHLWRSDDGWAISRIVKREEHEADRSGPGRPIAVEEIGIADATVVVDDRAEDGRLRVPSRIERLDASVAFHYEPVRYSVDIAHVSFRGAGPALALNSLTGGVSVRNDTLFLNNISVRTAESSLAINGAIEHYLTKPVVNVKAESDKLSLPELAAIFPALVGRPLTPSFALALNGPLSRLEVAANVRTSAGDVSARLVTDVQGAEQSIAGNVKIGHLDLAPVLADRTQKSDLTASAKVDLHGLSLARFDGLNGSIVFTSPHLAVAGIAADGVTGSAKLHGRNMAVDARAAMYGASVSATGDLLLPGKDTPFSYDVRGSAREVDLRKLPAAFNVPPAPTTLNADYHASGRGSQSVVVEANLLDSTVAGARIAATSTGSFSKTGDDIAYSADATVADLDLQRIGRAFSLSALDNDRYASTLNGHVVMTGSGTSAASLDIAANGTLADSGFASGRIEHLTFDTTFRADTLHVKAAGAFADLDPTVLSGKPALAGKVTGDVDIDTTIAGISEGLTLDGVQAAGRIALRPSMVGGLALDRAAIDGTYHDASGEIRQFELNGPDLTVEASGAIALNETGQSNLMVRADTRSLEALTMLVSQRAKGITAVNATVTGNRRDLRASGRLTGNDLEFRGQSALQLASDFTIQIRDLAFEHADVSAATSATFAVVLGQDINALTAKTEYHDKNIAFDFTAKQPQRSLSADGSLAIEPSQNQVSLNRLALETQNVAWRTAPDAHAEIRYGGGSVSVKDLRLVSGNQEIAATGTFGQPEDAMQVTAQNVSLATVDALLLRPAMLSGTLNASAEIAGTSDAPKMSGKFDIQQGAFRQAHYDSFTGTVNYEGRGLTLDTKLQQSLSNSIEAKGYVPVAAFKKTAAHEDGHREAAASKEDAFDLHIHSTPIDLALVQGLTTALTGVRGTTQAAIDVTGAADDPHPSGQITIENAAFTVAPTGVTYTDLDGRIELEPDRVHIVDIEVLDNDKQPLSITGDLAIHERQLGGVNIDVTARNFKIIKNEMGDLRMDSDLRVTGDLLRPRVEGDLGVTSGVINLDRVLAALGGPSAPTGPTPYTTRGGNLGRGAADPALVERVNAPEGSAGRAPGSAQPAAPPQSQATAAPEAAAGDTPRGGGSALTMDVHLTMADDFVLRSNDLTVPNAPIGLGAVNITIGGDLRLVKREGRDIVRLVGAVNTVRGTYDFQGRRFAVLRDGTIRFIGGRDVNPDLNVTAERAIQGVLANVNVRGTLKKPELVLTSVPPLEQSEILSLIVFNQPINQLGEGQQVALTQRAEQLAAGALASTLTNSLGKALNLTEFSIQAGSEPGTTAQITAGEQLNQNLYAKLEQGIGNISSTNFILEYEFAKWLRLRTNWLQGSDAQPLQFQRTQDSGVDLLFIFAH